MPEIGLVIRHANLWRSEQRAGGEEGFKHRPCVIVHARENEHQETEVFIAPITHTPPEKPERAMEPPQATKNRLGSDTEPSWIVTTEVNRFIWPGPDIRPVPSRGMAYGLLPARMSRDVVAKIRRNARDRRISIVKRDDEELTKEVRRRRKAGRASDREEGR